MGEENYEDLVDGTVDEVKQRVRDEELDIEEVLAAEKEGKDRVTLVDWLEEQLTEQEEPEDAGVQDSREEEPEELSETETTHDETQVAHSPGQKESIFASRHAVFGAGLVAGLVLATLVVVSGMMPVAGAPQSVTADAASDRLDTYIAENEDVFLPAQIRNSSSLTVETVEPYEDSSLYRATLKFSMDVGNQSRTQDVTGFMTGDAEYIVFGGQPFSLDRPAGEQVQRQQAPRS